MTRDELNEWLGRNAIELHTNDDFEWLTDQLVRFGFPVEDGAHG